MNDQLSSDRHPGLTRRDKAALGIAVLIWLILVIAAFAQACTIVPKQTIPNTSTGEWLHETTLAGQSGQEATNQARLKWLTLLGWGYGKYTLPALTLADKDAGWTKLPNGNWFVADNQVTEYGMMNYYFLKKSP